MAWIKKRIEAEKRKHGNMPQGLEKFNLDWERLAEIKIIASIMDYCYKNNTIKFKNCNLKLAVTNGGWINVSDLHNFLKGEVTNERILEG